MIDGINRRKTSAIKPPDVKLRIILNRYSCHRRCRRIVFIGMTKNRVKIEISLIIIIKRQMEILIQYRDGLFMLSNRLISFD